MHGERTVNAQNIGKVECFKDCILKVWMGGLIIFWKTMKFKEIDWYLILFSLIYIFSLKVYNIKCNDTAIH